MAGHSQFKNIMHRKGPPGRGQQAKIFTKLIREITTAARLGAADPAANPRLRAAMIAAREANMTRDTIDRAIKRGSGSDADANYDEVRYEGYGPGGVAVIVEALTNNRNRTAGEVRSSFSKFGGNLGETNSVSFMFDRMGEFRFPLEAGTADEVMEKAIDAGADDVVSGEGEEGAHEIYCAQENFNAVREALEKSLGQPSVGQADVAAQDHHADRGRDGADPARHDRRAGRQRRRPERLRQFRSVGRRSGEVRGLKRRDDETDRPRSRSAADRLGRDRRRGQPAAPCGARRGQGGGHGHAGRAARRAVRGVAAVVEAQQPAEAAVEETFVNINPGSTLKLGQARGVVCWRRRGPACRCSNMPPTW